MSVRNHLALILAAVLLPLLIGTGIFIGVVVPDRLDRNVHDELRLASGAVAALQSSTCARVGDAARIMALAVAKRETPQKALEDGVANQHMYAGITSAGKVLAISPSVPPGVVLDGKGSRCSDPLAGKAIASDSRGGPPYLSDVVTVSTASGPVTAVSAVLLDRDQLLSWRGQVGASSDLLMAVACPGGASGATMASARGRRLQDAALKVAQGVGRSRDVLTVDGNPTAITQPGTGQPCAVVASTQATGPLQSAKFIWWLLALALFLGALLVWWLARQLSLPLLALTDATNRAARGDLSVRLPVKRTDEVGQLAATFNNMAQQIDSRITEVRLSRDDLRENIHRLGEALQRTHDLDGLLATLCTIAATASDSQRVTAWLVEGRTLVARTGWPTHSVRAGPLRADVDSLPGRAAVDGVPRRLEAGHGDPSTLMNGPALAMPLHRGELMLGAILAERSEDAPAYTEQDESTLISITGPAGIAIHNAMLHREAQRLAVNDPLTGVGNLRQLTNTLAREVERARHFGRSMSLLILDIDHFKVINERHGHGAGDAVLHAIASRIVASVRPVDTVARYGGEEFAVICPELPPDEAVEFGGHVWDAIRRTPFVFGDICVDVRVSVGVASWPEQALTSTELLRAADAAVSEAKRLGRDRVESAATPTG